MSKSDFDKFVTEQQVHAPVDARVRRKKWLSHVEELYKCVEHYLQEYITRGDVKVTYKPLEINEEHLGTYKTNEMRLQIGSQRVSLVPVGAVIIGARGRVDLVGSRGRRGRLLLVGKSSYARGGFEEDSAQPELVWKFASAPPSRDLIELTSESLMDAIMEVAGG